ncbi:MAG: hypothetical protein LBV67_07350 [Streptococcaceae bacterium]|jgi:hypothetical protein|nr:hypothetical protein [Streptococcaceae bacterium]
MENQDFVLDAVTVSINEESSLPQGVEPQMVTWLTWTILTATATGTGATPYTG